MDLRKNVPSLGKMLPQQNKNNQQKIIKKYIGVCASSNISTENQQHTELHVDVYHKAI